VALRRYRTEGDIVEYQSGRHFLQIPGPTNVPDRVLRAMAAPTIDHRGPHFAELTREVLTGLKQVFKTAGPVVIFPSSGTGAWEAALVNTLSPGDHLLAFETGHFATLWCNMARALGFPVEFVPGDWRHGVDAALVHDRLCRDEERRIKAVTVVHNETSTGVTSRIAQIRSAIDAADHPCLLMVDVISSLASIDYRHDDWGVDVTVACSQKGLMLPPGLGFNAPSAKALAAASRSRYPRSYWDWHAMLNCNEDGFFPYTPATNLLYGLREALLMLSEEGLPKVFARHARYAEATRRAVSGWGLELVCQEPAEYSDTLTAVLLPDGHDADHLRENILDWYNMSLGSGLGKLSGRVFRVGHLGDLSELTLMGALCGLEAGLISAGVPVRRGGAQAALDYLRADPDTRVTV
jgi:alanine-glyoxylate transaminase/serine-glyoxylate transaminase/serine-pyruvate transaminase